MSNLKNIALLSLSVLTLAACGSAETTKEAAAESSSTAVESVVSEVASSDEASPTKNDTIFEGSNGTYEITAIEQMAGKYGDKQIIAITMNYTNTTEEAQNPWMAIAFDMSATQETDVTVETLMGSNGQYPEEYKPEAVAMGETDIKPGATVEAVVGYTLEFPGSPVFLRDMSMIGDDGTIFERIIETTAQ